MRVFELVRALKECDQALPVVGHDGAEINHVTLTYGEDGTFAYVVGDEVAALPVDQARERLAALGHNFECE